MVGLLDNCQFTSGVSGLSDFTVSAAVNGYRTPANAGATNGLTFYYRAYNSTNIEWEIGLGTYATSGTTLARTTVLYSSNSNNKVNFSTAPNVLATALLENMPITLPQGRLTLVTGTAVMTSDQTAKTHVYYTAYTGNNVPVYNGSVFQMWPFASDLDMALDTSNQLSGSVYDLFIYWTGSALAIGAGPAWSSTTARGTGAGTTELQQVLGIWTNKVSITLKNGAGAGTSVGANLATYVGSIYCTANGQTGVAFQPTPALGGTNNFVALFNAYNLIRGFSMSRDSTGNWTYATTTWRTTNNSSSNRITILDGLAVLNIFARTSILGGTDSGTYGAIGINRDSTTNTPNLSNGGGPGAGQQLPFSQAESFLPSLGLHYYQSMEIRAAGGANVTFYGSGYQNLTLELGV